MRQYRGGAAGNPLFGSYANGFTCDVAYGKLKLWFLSMLWKADKCDQYSFGEVTLGTQQRSDLTESIRSQLPGPAEYFAVVATLFDEGALWQRSLLKTETQGLWAKTDKGVNEYRNFYVFYLPGGFKVFIKLDERSLLPE